VEGRQEAEGEAGKAASNDGVWGEGMKPRAAMKLPPPTESQEQAAFIQWCELAGYPYNLIFAIPNGSHKSPATAAKFKREGLKSGVPDLFLPWAAIAYFGLFIEMKRKSGSSTSAEQKAWKEKLETEGYAHVFAYGADEAIDYIKQYVRGEL
jgi:hypothetical protein